MASKSLNVVYLIKSCYGSYEDYREEVICAFFSEASAQAEASRLRQIDAEAWDKFEKWQEKNPQPNWKPWEDEPDTAMAEKWSQWHDKKEALIARLDKKRPCKLGEIGRQDVPDYMVCSVPLKDAVSMNQIGGAS